MDKNIHKISVQDGVALYYVQNDDGTNKYIDIDVEKFSRRILVTSVVS